MSTALQYEVRANNLSHTSENRIHADDVARKFGFTGALVPGVEVYAYAMHPAVAQWGHAWLEHGSGEARFFKPVYDEALVEVTAEPAGDALALRVESGDQVSATGSASLSTPEAAPEVARWAWREPPAERPPASEATLSPGTVLCVGPTPLEADYLDGVRETEPLYRRERLAHPGQVLRMANRALTANVVLGPWIHVGSKVRNFGAARLGESVTARAVVLSEADHKGHRLVELDVMVLGEDRRALCRVHHTAIWRPRQLA
jgi:acyl dehydratase